MRFNHFIITRFNLPIWSQTKAGKISTIEDTYLQDRFHLFEKFCLPSIEQQTCQDFKWLVLFDINTPDYFKKKIEELQNRYNRFIPCFFDINNQNIENEYYDYFNKYISELNLKESDYKNTDEYIQRILTPNFISKCIHKYTKNEVDFIITTRIDNDDSFHKNFIEVIQNEVKSQNKFILLDYINGYRYILKNRSVSKFCFPNGHFTTLIEPYKTNLQTVIYWNHFLAHKIIPIKHINCKPMYIELIHNSNVINDEQQYSLPDFIYALKHFKHSDFGYKGIHLSLKQIFKSTYHFAILYTKNYINHHFSVHKYFYR